MVALFIALIVLGVSFYLFYKYFNAVRDWNGRFIRKRDLSATDWVWTSVWSLLIGGAFFALINFTLSGIGAKKVTVTLEEHNLKALNVDSQTESSGGGAFFLIIGGYSHSSSEDQVATYIEEVEPGIFKMQEEKMQHLYLSETGDKPTVSVLGYEYQKDDGDIFWSFGSWWFDENTKRVINVPEGTILNTYEVNGKVTGKK